MTARWWTIGILVAVTLLLIAWDVYAATNKERGDTISEVVLAFARRLVRLIRDLDHERQAAVNRARMMPWRR